MLFLHYIYIYTPSFVSLFSERSEGEGKVSTEKEEMQQQDEIHKII